jgi:hypothetical protein
VKKARAKGYNQIFAAGIDMKEGRMAVAGVKDGLGKRKFV